MFFDYITGSIKKTGKHRTGPPNSESNVESGLDLSDLDLSSIEFSEREMRALSGLTPALSRRLQRQLLAHLPPAAARTLRRALSVHGTGVRAVPPARSLSADHEPERGQAEPEHASRDPSAQQEQEPRARARDPSANHDQEARDPSANHEQETRALARDPTVNHEQETRALARDPSAHHKQETQALARDPSANHEQEPRALARDPSAAHHEQKTLALTREPSANHEQEPRALTRDHSANYAQETRALTRDPSAHKEHDEPTPHKPSTLSSPTALAESAAPAICTESAVPTVPIDSAAPTASVDPPPSIDQSVLPTSTPQYSTLPRPRRRSSSREVTPLLAGVDVECPSPNSLIRDPLTTLPRDRPLLSKYLTPERTLSLDDTYGSDSGSGTSQPSSVAVRRHSLRAAGSGDQPRHRFSRFLRSDFFDSPPDENLYERQRKERELETQKILREIREKRNKSQEATPITEAPLAFKDDITAPKKCRSPIGLVGTKERSRSNTPFFPFLDNIKETAVDSSASTTNSKRYIDLENSRQKTAIHENSSSKDSRLIRPKSYPVKTLDAIDEPSENLPSESSFSREYDNGGSLPSESKLIRPKSYPASSPSPEKVYISRKVEKEDAKDASPKDKEINPDIKSDVEVSFSFTLPKKKTDGVTKSNLVKKYPKVEQSTNSKSESEINVSDTTLSLKKYSVIKNTDNDKSESTEANTRHSMTVSKPSVDVVKVTSNGDTKHTTNQPSKKDETDTNNDDTEQIEKKSTLKKKIIRKVSSKSKADLKSNQETSDAKTNTEKKKVTKKVKDKVTDENGTKSSTVIKKKSVLQSIGHKLEKFAYNKSSASEKGAENSLRNEMKKDSSKLSRLQREQSVPVNVEPPTESNVIQRAVTLSDVAALETQQAPQNKTTVSKVLGLFKKIEPKERSKPMVEKSRLQSVEQPNDSNYKTESNCEASADSVDRDKPRRPTSLLLNGLGSKNTYGRTSRDSVPNLSEENDDQSASQKENEKKNNRNSLKLDFSRLPRVKKIVPTNPVIESQIMNISSVDSETEKKDIPEKNDALVDDSIHTDNTEAQSRSRSRSRSTISNSELKSDISADNKFSDRNLLSPPENTTVQLRSHDSTTPEKEDIVDRIRRKSFYLRFNENKQRRKSSLVGPGAAEYDPVARIHSQPTDTKYDVSPTSPLTYDLSPLSPGLSVSSDLSPSTERYRCLLTGLPVNTRSNLRFDNYGVNDKIDTYRSLDRNDFRKYPGSRNYLDSDQRSSNVGNRYSRTKSFLDSSDSNEDNSLVNSLRDRHKYNRTISMYSPGNYATYRPNRTTRNSAIILKESEKEPSPENILEKIRQRKKISISVTRKPDAEKETLPRCV